MLHKEATPPPGFEPGTNRLTVCDSTAELQGNKVSSIKRNSLIGIRTQVFTVKG